MRLLFYKVNLSEVSLRNQVNSVSYALTGNSAEAARDLGLHPSVLYRWVKGYGGDSHQAFPGHGQQGATQAEITSLRREVRKLKAERDILKKAAAYFASASL